MKLPILECKRCGATWVPRIATRPKQCPTCKSLAWDRAKKSTRVTKKVA